MKAIGLRNPADETGRALVSLVRALPAFLDGALLEEGYVFNFGATQTLTHGLGRPWRGFLVVSDVGGPGAFTATAYDNDNSITLTNQGNPTTAKFWVW
jgi:hypothetical protein